MDDRLPDPPADLDNEALAEWRRVVPVLDEMGLLTRADRAVPTGYCQSWARWMAAELTIAEEGATYISGTLMKRHPEVVDALEQSRMMRQYALDLGMSPRVRQGMDTKPAAPRKLSLIAERLGGG